MRPCCQRTFGRSRLAESAERLAPVSYHEGSRLFVFSATEMDESFQPVTTLRLSDHDREENFPVGNLLDNGALYISYISRGRGGPNDLLGNPFSPYLKILDTDFQTLQYLEVGEGGFAHVHPMLRSGVRLLVAWSKAIDMGSFQAPQVQIEEFSTDDASVDQQASDQQSVAVK